MNETVSLVSHGQSTRAGFQIQERLQSVGSSPERLGLEEMKGPRPAASPVPPRPRDLQDSAE